MFTNLFRALPVVGLLVVAIALLFVVQPSVVLAAEQAIEQSGWLDSLLSVLPDWLQAIGLLIAAFSSIAALTPTPKDDGILRLLKKIVDFLALNVGGANNEKPFKSNRTDS